MDICTTRGECTCMLPSSRIHECLYYICLILNIHGPLGVCTTHGEFIWIVGVIVSAAFSHMMILRNFILLAT